MTCIVGLEHGGKVMKVLQEMDDPPGPTAQVQVALGAAEAHNARVRGPFKVVSA